MAWRRKLALSRYRAYCKLLRRRLVQRVLRIARLAEVALRLMMRALHFLQVRVFLLNVGLGGGGGALPCLSPKGLDC